MSRKSSCYVTIGDIEFTCDYTYYKPIWVGPQSLDPPEPAEVENLEISFGGHGFTELLDQVIVDRIIDLIIEQEGDE